MRVSYRFIKRDARSNLASLSSFKSRSKRIILMKAGSPPELVTASVMPRTSSQSKGRTETTSMSSHPFA